MWRLLAPGLAAPAPVPLYASGLNPSGPEELAAAKRAEDYRAFKLKVGFGADSDDANLDAMHEVIGLEPRQHSPI